MTAIAAAAIVSGGLGIYKTIEGANQRADAKELASRNKFTPMELPGQVKLATNLAAQNYYNGMPGTAAAQQMIGQNGANAFYNGTQGASSGGDLLDLAAKINQGQNVATNNLSNQAANYKANALGGYQNALNNEGQWEGKLYENNTLQPYLRTANTAASLEGAGAMNMFSGIDQIGTAALGYASAQNPSTSVDAGTMGQKYGRSALSAVNPYHPTNYDPSIAAAMAGASMKKRGY
jgi:hypothetical protein